MPVLSRLLCLAAMLAIAYPAFAEPGVVAEAPADGVPHVETDAGYLVPYTETIPGTDVTFEMVPVAGGVVTLPVGADGEDASCEVTLPPYWVGRTEVTWAEYRLYMSLDGRYAELQQLATLGQTKPDSVASAMSSAPQLDQVVAALPAAGDAEQPIPVDAVTAPTPLYDPSTTYESGEDPDLPAVTMTPFAAQQYTKWLSALVGEDYRLPSEAEWLHAAGESSADVDDAAWYTDNSDYVAQTVGQKAPNARGLFDTLGNAAELVLDGFYPEGRPSLAGQQVDWQTAVAWPRKGDRRIAKGGWWDSEAEEVNTATRMVTEPLEWKESDPNLPKSPWWYADYPSTGVGFRLVRPLEPMSAETRAKVWNASDPVVAKSVAERLREGRGKLGPIGVELPAVLEELDSNAVQRLLR